MTDSRKQEPIRVLVADDQPPILEAVELLLSPHGISVDCVRSPRLLLEALGQNDYDVLLIDLNYTRDTTSGQEGLDLLARIQEMDPRIPVIVMTAWGNIDLAVESIKRGARDFVQKPWENERLLSLIRVHAELHHALRRARQLMNLTGASYPANHRNSLLPGVTALSLSLLAPVMHQCPTRRFQKSHTARLLPGRIGIPLYGSFTNCRATA